MTCVTFSTVFSYFSKQRWLLAQWRLSSSPSLINYWLTLFARATIVLFHFATLLSIVRELCLDPIACNNLYILFRVWISKIFILHRINVIVVSWRRARCCQHRLQNRVLVGQRKRLWKFFVISKIISCRSVWKNLSSILDVSFRFDEEKSSGSL